MSRRIHRHVNWIYATQFIVLVDFVVIITRPEFLALLVSSAWTVVPSIYYEVAIELLALLALVLDITLKVRVKILSLEGTFRDGSWHR